ncbi:hypothetical protein CCAX7_40930 [Capsulimonas corticalis]|uniref:Uncharacterized protein n=1 Tax=Capsulimonas corticalis TaxID=2219043 RepID=A0A402D6E3_9BACT|nr:DUF5010 domain-containing protein [Capsulimonas corticalis]BDI32042.1 hypothetical protein CCAX7_40930 [Capsulimonas corticalis]
MRNTAVLLAAMAATLMTAVAAHAQFVGVTCGWNYSNDLSGPNTGMANTPLFNPDPANPNRTWDEWAEELGASGVDFVCPNLRGSYPETGLSPVNIAPLITALNNRGLNDRIKLAIFDDNASSWTAEWNEANGRGFGYAQPFDISNSANWTYLWDYNYKLFYQTVPDANRFKINGRPVIILWTGNTYFIGNMQGNMSRALLYVRQQCQSTFGFNPYIIVSGDTLSHDTTCNNPSVVDAVHNWFNPNSTGAPGYTLTNFNNVLTGALCPQFQTAANGSWVDANHGVQLDTSLQNTHGAGAQLTLIEGFTDWEEDAALFRGRNLDPTGASLGYSSTYYDYPNQRLNITRKNSNNPFPADLKEEIEGCDTFGGGVRSGPANYYRNGPISIETTADAGGGFDVGNIQANQWFEWQAVPVQGAKHFLVRVATTAANCRVHFVIDGSTKPSVTLPNTGGWQTWTTVDAGSYGAFAAGSTHTVRLVCETGGMNLNYWKLGGTIPIGSTISLQSRANNNYVTASATGASPLIASSATVGTAQLFTVVDMGNGCVALRAQINNDYVCADNGGAANLINNRTSAGLWETFQWIENTDGTISLKSNSDQEFVCAENAGANPLIANRPGHGLWEGFNYAIH